MIMTFISAYSTVFRARRPALRCQRFFDDELREVFRAVDLRAVDFLEPLLFFAVLFRFGTFAPASRASDKPIAIAC
jgi:hypothetical protein